MRRLIISAFFMYLQQVYKHNRWLFLIIIFFITGQLFINYKHGLVISPFYHYGMFSDVFTPINTYEIIKVEQNGKILRGQDFSAQEWDKIILPVVYFANINSSNSLFNTDIKRLVAQLHLSAAEKNFLLKCNYQEFENWYKNYLRQVTNQQTTSLHIYFHQYRYALNTLVATDSVTLLSQKCN